MTGQVLRRLVCDYPDCDATFEAPDPLDRKLTVWKALGQAATTAGWVEGRRIGSDFCPKHNGRSQ